MNILAGLLNQVAVYWQPGIRKEDGSFDYTAVTPIEVVCYWNNTKTEAVDPDGETVTVMATVFISVEVKRRGVLWLSTATINDPAGTALAAAPDNPPMDRIIQTVVDQKDIEAIETLWVATV